MAKRGSGLARPPQQPARKPLLPNDPRVAQAVQNYEAGLKAMQAHKFERAQALLEKVVVGPSRELADRAAVHLHTCEQHLARTATAFKTPAEHYDYAVSLMNAGDHDGARAHLEKILKQAPGADYALYGLAVLECLTGRVEESLKRLDQAIRQNPANRYQARNDSDFQNLADDPRFTELLYPEPEAAPVAAAPSAGKKSARTAAARSGSRRKQR
ncbi:MAG: tetratricopeptide repeat protein [Terriglobales bacterium]